MDFRAGLASLLAADLRRARNADDGNGIEDAVERLCPDVVVLDISMPNVEGFDAARRLLKVCPDAKIIFLSSHSEPDYEREARAIGASGFINKERTAKDLLPVLRIVKENGTAFSP